MEQANKKNEHVNKAVDITLKLGFLLLLVGWCLFIITPFTNIIIWAIIIAVTIYPLHNYLKKRLAGKRKLTAAIITILLLAVLILPSIKFTSSMAKGIKEFAKDLKNQDIGIPPPAESVAEWPLVGGYIHGSWELASDNLEGFIKDYEAELIKIGNWILNGVVGTGLGLLQFLLSVIIAGILLIGSDEAHTMSRRFYRKIVGEERGEDFAEATEQTIRQVAKGVLGVAFIQSFLFGVVFLLAGLPYAGLWAFICLILSIVQIGPTIVSICVIIYFYSVKEPLPATLWTIPVVVVSLLNNFLQPLIMGKGSPVPTLVIFLGAIGGLLVSGFLGLFIGAIVLSLGYKLFMIWINSGEQASTSEANPVK